VTVYFRVRGGLRRQDVSLTGSRHLIFAYYIEFGNACAVFYGNTVGLALQGGERLRRLEHKR
jgi:hypothetical protein